MALILTKSEFLAAKISILQQNTEILDGYLRKEDDKLCFLTETLAKKNVFTPQEKNAVMAMEPFAEMSSHKKK